MLEQISGFLAKIRASERNQNIILVVKVSLVSTHYLRNSMTKLTLEGLLIEESPKKIRSHCAPVMLENDPTITKLMNRQ